MPPDLLLEQLYQLFDISQLLSQTITGELTIPGMSEPIIILPIGESGDVIKLLIQTAEARSFYLFFRCVDIKGTESDDFFMKLNVGEETSEKPIVSLVSPNAIKQDENVTFKYTVQSSASTIQCWFYDGKKVDGVVSDFGQKDGSILIPVSGTIQSFELTDIPDGEYLWNVGCKYRAPDEEGFMVSKISSATDNMTVTVEKGFDEDAQQ
jgi:hypothetical protein